MMEPRLFPDEAAPNVCRDTPQTELTGRSPQVQRSALWAAYGDALGWISELTDAAGLQRRTAGRPLCQPMEWTRRIGGRGGIVAQLPRGCYSDDSQLRLATSRAIRPDGFDVEAFAKIELPTWLSYALGGGKSTSAAAMNLAKPKVPWFANQFKGWSNSGGNGAAMRIQPHVWAAPALTDPASFLPDVIRNAICTHSHPTGLMGAILHALALAHTIATRRPPTPDDLLQATDVAASLPDLMQSDPQVGSYWRAAFEREAGDFNDAWARAIAESRDAIQLACLNPKNASGEARYAEIINRLRLREAKRRGSGVLTAVAAASLTWCETDPEEALRIAANALDTDTDTIATMAGAILGVIAESDPPVEVLDAALFQSESERLAEIAEGGQPPSYQYPDLLRWSAPKTRADTLTCAKDGSLHVLGLGAADAKSEPMASRQKGFEWQWLQLKIGQTLFIKRRATLANGGAPVSVNAKQPSRRKQRHADGSALDAYRPHSVRRERRSENFPTDPAMPPKPLNVKRAVDYVSKHSEDDRQVGRLLRRVVNECSPGEIAACIGLLIEVLRQPAK